MIGSLSENPRRRHVSYRDSKLTRILKESLGGNSKTSLVACVSPSFDSFSETLSTLHFACKAKLVRNQIVRNSEVRRVLTSQRDSRERAPKTLRRPESGRGQPEDTCLSHNRRGTGDTLGPRALEGDRDADFRRLQKKAKMLKEKLKICERERQIALSALQQHTDHLHLEKQKRKKLEEKVGQLELMLELGRGESREEEGEVRGPG